MTSLADRFWSKVRKDDACWEWLGTFTRGGYGFFRGGALGTRPHRIAYQLEVGPIADGEWLDHLCLNPQCVRPDHLEVVTPAENMRRGLGSKPGTHCARGHVLAGTNVVPIVLNGKAQRRCRTCVEEYERNRNARRRSARAGRTA